MFPYTCSLKIVWLKKVNLKPLFMMNFTSKKKPLKLPLRKEIAAKVALQLFNTDVTSHASVRGK